MKKIVSIFLVLILCLGLVPSAARAAEVTYPVTGGNIIFDTDTGTVTGSDETVTSVEIPAEIAGVRVTAIGDEAFSNCRNMTRIRLPDTLIAIGDCAFESALSLTSIVIPDSVTEMGSGVFIQCNSLTSVTLGKGLTTLPICTFENCIALTDLIIPEGYTVIEGSAFAFCLNLKTVSLPASLTIIEDCAFNYCDCLTDVYFAGNQAQWKGVDIVAIDYGNDALNSAAIHFNATAPSAIGPSSDWAKPEIEKAGEMNLIPEVLKSQDLTQPITRAEFAAVAVKVFESLSGGKAVPVVNNPFIDTKDMEVLKAYGIGAVLGTSATTFAPNALLDREQCATMLTRVFKRITLAGWTLATDSQFKLNYRMPAKFADDQDISSWARDSVYFMAANKIINGMGNNKFVPKNTTSLQEAQGYANATREQALAIAVRMVENLK